MNKILLIPFLMINLTFAEYMAKVPLEQSNGGSLPNGSITIKSSSLEIPSEDTPEAGEIVCVNNRYTYWHEPLVGQPQVYLDGIWIYYLNPNVSRGTIAEYASDSSIYYHLCYPYGYVPPSS